MKYYKVVNEAGDIIDALAGEPNNPLVYVKKQERNGVIVTCKSEYYAHGVVALNGSNIYQLDGRESLNLDNGFTAIEIYGTEYFDIIETIDDTDPEDDDPDVPEGDDEPMTRAELTALVQEQAETIEMLTECILEMSELVYGEEG